MKLTLKLINCNAHSPYVINESADSCIEFHIEFERILTMQSRKILLDQLKGEIQSELKKIQWLITGKVQLDINWFLNSVYRQETDKIGDLDNITKPLIDSLSGYDGVIIDDSQFNSINTSWMTRNLLKTDNLVIMKLHFINDWTVKKENLYFLEVSPAIYTPLNFNISSKKDLQGIKIYLNAIKGKRLFAEGFKNIGVNADRYLVYSEYDFHRTRLSGFQSMMILNETTFKTLCDNHKV